MLLILLIVLGATSEHDTGDRLTCAMCIILVGCYMLMAEQITPFPTMCFVLLALFWGFILQPSVLNRCHLTIWLLILGAFRNLITLETHATTAWRFSTISDVFRILLCMV